MRRQAADQRNTYYVLYAAVFGEAVSPRPHLPQTALARQDSSLGAMNLEAFAGKARLLKGNVTKAGNMWLVMLTDMGTLAEERASA